MRQYGESKTNRIMMTTVPHVTSSSGLRKFQADGFLFDRLYIETLCEIKIRQFFKLMRRKPLAEGSLGTVNLLDSWT